MMSNNFDDNLGFGHDSQRGDSSTGENFAFESWGAAFSSPVPEYRGGQASADSMDEVGFQPTFETATSAAASPTAASSVSLEEGTSAAATSSSAARATAPASGDGLSLTAPAAVGAPEYFEPGSYHIVNSGKAWSFSDDGTTMRFEVRSGDVTQGDIDDGQAGKERSEIASAKEFYEDRTYNIHFDFMVEQGARNTADWLVLAQIQQTLDPLDGFASPPFSIGLRGEKLIANVRWTTDPVTPVNPPSFTFTDTTDIERGRWYDIDLQIRFDSDGGGFMKLYRDNGPTPLFEYNGPLGYVDEEGPRWKEGVYRESSPETMAVNYRGVEIVGEGLPPPVNGTGGDDDLFGGWESEKLYGLAGNDILDGGARPDEMFGGAGNDTYIVDDVGDAVSELNGRVDAGGLDSVTSYITYTLGSFLENLQLAGRSAIDATGNALDNRLLGNAGANTIKGLEGADFVNAAAGADVVDGGDGADTLYGGEDNDSVAGGIGNDQLYGETGDDTLDGGEGDDSLRGDAGVDTMAGGAGNDTYYVDNARDIVREAANGGLDAIYATATYSIASTFNVEELRADTAAAIDLTGNSAANTIAGGAGVNVIRAGAGDDKVSGGAGNDTLYGEDGADTVFGEDGADIIEGGIGDDTLNGGAGIDRMTGGIGNDSYYVDSASDVVVEAVRGGSDIVYASVSYTLGAGAEIETMQLLNPTSTASLNMIGNEFANTIRGGAGANTLGGNGGDDRIFGGLGKDLVNGDAGNDSLSGEGGADTLNGGDGIDRLDGGTEADTMSGGAGDDTYFVDNSFDVVNEVAGGGLDTVYTSVNFFLKATSDVEIMRTISATATTRIAMIGSDIANTMFGNAGTNVLTGGKGDDRLNGDASMDLLSGGEGNDTLNGGLGNDNLAGGLGNDIYYTDNAADIVDEAAGGGIDTVYASANCNLGADMEVEVMRTAAPTATTTINMIGSKTANTIYGNAGSNVLSGVGGDDRLNGDAGNDLLSGGDGNDNLSGGLGIDNMIGGAGNDIYSVDNSRDVVTEATGGGLDTVNASVSYILNASSEVEILKAADVAATTAIDLTGNGIVNTVRGNAGANTINGRGGIDQLYGYGGNDVFVFSSVAEAGDRINDFGLGDDTLHLDNAGFGPGVGLGTLAQSGVDFVVGTKALAANETLIYNSANGQLFWDGDGTGSGAATLVSFLANKAALTAADFHFI